MTKAHLIAQVNQCLPQTQCGECDYDGCQPYAEAMVEKGEAITKCPPGGVKTLIKLANLLDQDPTPYLKAAGSQYRHPSVANIIETECIGCTKCIQACPVDAILGTGKHMHTVINHECTGCGLCVEPCPVDCIELLPVPTPTFQPALAKRRFNERNQRLALEESEKANKHEAARILKANESKKTEQNAKKAYIQAALNRVNKKKQGGRAITRP